MKLGALLSGWGTALVLVSAPALATQLPRVLAFAGPGAAAATPAAAPVKSTAVKSTAATSTAGPATSPPTASTVTTSTVAEPPPSASAASPGAAVAADSAAPAAVPAVSAGDDWAQLIRHGKAQERANETDEERERREERLDREQEPVLDAATLAQRSRLRFFAFAGVGAQYFTNFELIETDAKLGPSAMRGGFGWGIELGLGLRGSIASHFDLQTRLAFAIKGLNSTAEASPPSGRTLLTGQASSTMIGARLDGTVRWLPQLFGPRFFVGLGPSFEIAKASVSGTLEGGPPSHIKGIGTLLILTGLLELGMVWGAHEDWELALRTAAGKYNVGALPFISQLCLARAF